MYNISGKRLFSQEILSRILLPHAQLLRKYYRSRTTQYFSGTKTIKFVLSRAKIHAKNRQDGNNQRAEKFFDESRDICFSNNSLSEIHGSDLINHLGDLILLLSEKCRRKTISICACEMRKIFGEDASPLRFVLLEFLREIALQVTKTAKDARQR